MELQSRLDEGVVHPEQQGAVVSARPGRAPKIAAVLTVAVAVQQGAVVPVPTEPQAARQRQALQSALELPEFHPVQDEHDGATERAVQVPLLLRLVPAQGELQQACDDGEYPLPLQAPVQARQARRVQRHGDDVWQRAREQMRARVFPFPSERGRAQSGRR
jgi:hypothetical protein